jgi:hypothetical protein
MPDPIPSPHCGAPAHNAERSWLDCTHGSIEHRTTSADRRAVWDRRQGADYRMTTGWWDRGRAIGGTSSPNCASSTSQPPRSAVCSCQRARAGAARGCSGRRQGPSEIDDSDRGRKVNLQVSGG